MKNSALGIVVAVLAFSGSAWAGPGVNIDAKGVALHGHDPVAYFTVGQPTKGDAKYQASHQGATYYFASAANRDRFRSQPDKYAPRYGGYCAMGAAMGKKLDVDPTAWRIVDDKLYLNVNADIQKKWLSDVPGHIVKGDKNWVEIRDKAPNELQ